jgi:hypothetical protein
MELTTFLRQSYNELYERIRSSCQDLSDEELRWRPAPHSNHIAAILWHLIRAEDRVVSEIIPERRQVWLAHGWCERFGHDREQASAPFAAIDWTGLPFAPVRLLLDYYEAVHINTLDFLKTIGPTDFDRVVDAGRPYRTVGALLRHSIIHASNHHGQIDYLKGLQRSEWDLPPGSGMKQE